MKRFILFGIAFIFFGIASSIGFALFANNSVKTEGVITRIEAKYDYVDRKDNYTVFVSYQVDGVEYESRLWNWNPGTLKVGDSVVIYYSPINPLIIQSNANNGFAPYFLFGALFVLVGVLVLIRKSKNINNKPENTAQSDYDKAIQMLSGRK